MHVASNRLHISQDRVKPFGIHPWFLPPRAQRWVQPPTCASFRQNAVVADVGNTPCDAAASQASATSRRHALSLLAGNAVVLTSNAVGMAAPSTAWAALKDYNLDPNQPIEEVAVQLGTENGQYAFIPSTLEFTAGKIYKLKLRNPSTSTHYFTAFEFAEKVFSIMVLAGDPAVEVKGGIQEVALKAGASATWVFIPIKPGKYPLRCTVKGHDAMVGQIIIKRPVQ
ncbi:hypothetical protein Vretimale_7574 [Volvox reticuliferus]|uniref:Uncharacterized protein n=1 Tax=Volvox reticuliferus TaxID=1737510 RepID=A0A8J4FJW8_9CHLO|nr:hypothetical protein Vretifemale_7606 [Volvox reticuliferus]GIM02719.1 hypothetical protein Vretimale_7574 [Volvox reticuliferus]